MNVAKGIARRRTSFVGALVAAVLATTGAAVQEVYARNEASCVDYACKTGDNQACKDIKGLACDVCHTDNRCAMDIP